MNNAKNFNLFLMDGKVTGRIKCTLSNWTGLAYKIPSAYLDDCKDRSDLKQSGVYFSSAKMKWMKTRFILVKQELEKMEKVSYLE